MALKKPGVTEAVRNAIERSRMIQAELRLAADGSEAASLKLREAMEGAARLEQTLRNLVERPEDRSV